MTIRKRNNGYIYTLVYSPDDGGYYWEKYPGWETSKVYKTKAAAMDAYYLGKVIYK